MWFYHKVPLDEGTQGHPLVVKELGLLREQPPSVDVDEGMEEAEAHVTMLREVSKVFGTRDLVEEYIACKYFPVHEWWSVTLWAGKEKCVGGLPMPNFSTSFGVMKNGKSDFFLILCSANTDVDPCLSRLLLMKSLELRLRRRGR